MKKSSHTQDAVRPGERIIPQWVIESKRDGHTLSGHELRSFIAGYTRGEIPDYQMAALAMAIYFQGLNADETAELADAMMRSGTVLDTNAISRPKVDKHSTGGVGDKISLVLAPLAACCGLAVPMISGRGLGITGGTLDKMQSIPGLRVDLCNQAFLDVVNDCGCSIIGQTDQLAPADRKLYALRDVTGTVPSIPLITASILSKKMAAGLDGLVLDVKWGRGAFMKTQGEARRLAESLVGVGRRMGGRVSALLTAMDQPLGRTVGNSLEVREALASLQGEGPDDVRQITLALAARMLVMGGLAADDREGRRQAETVLASGEALECFGRMTALQGGERRVIENPALLPQADLRAPVPAPQRGYIADVDANAVGRAALVLGAGRTKTDDTIDHAVGLDGLVKIGEPVDEGQPLAMLHANDADRLAEARRLLERAFVLAGEAPPGAPLIGDIIA